MTPSPATPCALCGGSHPVAPSDTCPAMRAAAAVGARPPGVPLRVYGAYLEARAALKGNAPVTAAHILEWLIGHLAEERGMRAGDSVTSTLQKLCDEDIISPRVRDALLQRATARPPEQAWALMSIVEHALQRLYLQPRQG